MTDGWPWTATTTATAALTTAVEGPGGRYWVGLGQSSGFPLALWATLTIWPWMASGAAGREKLGGFVQGNPRRGLPSPVDEARGLLTSPSRELRNSSENKRQPIESPPSPRTVHHHDHHLHTCPYSLVTPSAAAKSETVLLGRAQAETLLSCRVGEQEL